MSRVSMQKHTVVTKQNLEAVNGLLRNKRGVILNAALCFSKKKEGKLTGAGLMHLFFCPHFDERGCVENIDPDNVEDREYRLLPREIPRGELSWNEPETPVEQLLIGEQYTLEIRLPAWPADGVGLRDFFFLFIPLMCDLEPSFALAIRWMTARINSQKKDFIFTPKHNDQMVEYISHDLLTGDTMIHNYPHLLGTEIGS